MIRITFDKSAKKSMYCEHDCLNCAALIVVMIIVCASFFMLSFNLNTLSKSEQAVQKDEKTTIVNLYVVDKRSYSFGATSVIHGYYLVLSNGMQIDVSEKQYKQYEKGEYYDFEIIETTTVSQKIRVITNDEK